ncbi:MAG: hypothetical protein GQ576_03510 [Methanococcoides sp.]|nr:hypothetical protein [Methanococcoides sp.]
MTEERIDVKSSEDVPGKRKTKKQLLTAFKADLHAADSLRLEAVQDRDEWKAQYNGEPYGNEEKGKSELVSRDIKRQDEWQHASVKDPFVSDQDIIKCKPITFEDVKSAQQNELVLNYQFTRQFNRYKFMTDVIKLYYSEGTVIVKTSWCYEDSIEQVEVPKFAIDPMTGEPIQIGVELVRKLKVLINKPDAEICRLEDIYMDPTAEGDVDRAQFFIHRYESDLSSLRKAKKYKNLNKLAVNMARDNGDFDPTDETEFVFEDQARKKIIVHEYWGNYDIKGTGIAVPIICTWVNDTIIQLEDNPYPEQSMPFLVLANNSIPFKLYGEAAAELVGDNQKITTAVKRGILDNMANSNNAQKGLRTGALDTLNTKRFLNGKNFTFNGSTADFFEGSYNNIPASVFSVLEMVNNETESMLGVKDFSAQGGHSLGSTAKAAGGVLDAVSVRKLDIVRNIAENLVKPLMRKWMEYNSEFLQPEEIVRVTNEEFVEIKRDDLKGMIDISIQVSTAEDNSAKAQELAFMLQTGQQSMDEGEVRLIRAEIARLQKMPELAKKIEDYQPPEPDPYIQEMRELEKQKLMAEIEERLSRARENEVDLRAKTAKAILDEARARKLGSDTDMVDLEFTRKAEGKDFDEKMTEKEFDRTTNAGMKIMENKDEK